MDHRGAWGSLGWTWFPSREKEERSPGVLGRPREKDQGGRGPKTSDLFLSPVVPVSGPGPWETFITLYGPLPLRD